MSKLKNSGIDESFKNSVQPSTICRQLKLQSADGKNYETDCANTEGIIQGKI